MSSSTAIDKKENSNELLEVKFVPIPETLSKSFQNVFTNYKDGLVKSIPGGLVMGPRYAASADKIMSSVFWLGIYPGLTEEMLTYVATTIREFCHGQ